MEFACALSVVKGLQLQQQQRMPHLNEEVEEADLTSSSLVSAFFLSL